MLGLIGLKLGLLIMRGTLLHFYELLVLSAGRVIHLYENIFRQLRAALTISDILLLFALARKLASAQRAGENSDNNWIITFKHKAQRLIYLLH